MTKNGPSTRANMRVLSCGWSEELISLPPAIVRVLRLPGHDHWRARGLDDGVADRTQEHAGESAAPVAADDDKLCGLGIFDEGAGRSVTDEAPVHRHVGVAFLPARQSFGQNARLFDLYR